MTGKRFHISDVLSIGTSRLLSNRDMGGVYDILNYMTGDDLFTHQLPRAHDICEPYILGVYPWMKTLDLTRLDFPENWDEARISAAVDAWVKELASLYGEHLDVYPIASEDWEYINPVDEAIKLVGEEKVIVVEKKE